MLIPAPQSLAATDVKHPLPVRRVVMQTPRQARLFRLLPEMNESLPRIGQEGEYILHTHQD